MSPTDEQPTPSSAAAVVIGGGVLGTSVGVHLLRAGVTDCLLLERDGVGQATSAAGAGFIDTWAAGSQDGTGPEEIAIEHYAIDFYRELHEARPESPYRQRGCLWIATTEADWPYVERWLAEGPADARAVDPDEIEALTSGTVRAAGVFRGVLRPSSAQISAEKATRALAAAFVAEGGRLAERHPVERILVEDRRVVGVRTVHGDVASDTVVLAAGAWTNVLLRDLGVFLPIAPLAVSRIVTETCVVPGDLPLLFLRGEHTGLPRSLWVREENGGLMYGTNYETPARYAYVEGDPPERFDRLGLDGVMRVRRDAAKLAGALPLLGEDHAFQVAHGVPCYTVDGRGIVGPVPGIDGLHVLAGCNEQGVTHGPGFGRVLAETIVRGRSDLADIRAWRVDRFGGDPAMASVAEVVAAL